MINYIEQRLRARRIELMNEHDNSSPWNAGSNLDSVQPSVDAISNLNDKHQSLLLSYICRPSPPSLLLALSQGLQTACFHV